MSEKKKYRFETVGIHGGLEADPVLQVPGRCRSIKPILISLITQPECGKPFRIERRRLHLFQEYDVPTYNVVEERVAELEGGVAAAGLRVGWLPISTAIFNIAESGDEIVSASTLYGERITYSQRHFRSTVSKLIFVNPQEPENFRRAITPKTKATFCGNNGKSRVKRIGH